jgi:hypothetical protein
MTHRLLPVRFRLTRLLSQLWSRSMSALVARRIW